MKSREEKRFQAGSADFILHPCWLYGACKSKVKRQTDSRWSGHALTGTTLWFEVNNDEVLLRKQKVYIKENWFYCKQSIKYNIRNVQIFK